MAPDLNGPFNCMRLTFGSVAVTLYSTLKIHLMPYASEGARNGNYILELASLPCKTSRDRPVF